MRPVTNAVGHCSIAAGTGPVASCGSDLGLDDAGAGHPNHFHWLARSLMQAGWPVLVLEHPGSDAAAVQGLLEGRQSFDGAAALRDRLADLEAVLEAQQRGDLNIPGTEVVLMGHSLGALTALLAMGSWCPGWPSAVKRPWRACPSPTCRNCSSANWRQAVCSTAMKWTRRPGRWWGSTALVG